MRTTMLVAPAALVMLAAGCGGILSTDASATLTLEVAEGRVPCMGEGPRECLLVREAGAPDYGLFYDAIEGFVYEPGFRYRLVVSRHAVPNPPADGSSLAYRLVRVDRKERSPGHALLTELAARTATWRATRPARYRAVVERVCFCGQEARGPVEVDVTVLTPGGMEHVEERRYVGSGVRVASHLAPFFPAVDGLFGVIIRAVADDANVIDVEYHATMGYPTRVYIDLRAGVADDEVEYRLVSVTAR
jgi:hypothetical protein